MKASPVLIALIWGVALGGPTSSCKLAPSQARGQHGERHDTHPAGAGAVVGLPGVREGRADAGPLPPEMPAGYSAISVEPAHAASIGLTTSRVEERELVRHLRTTGLVVVDETRTAHVHSKVRGWVDGIGVNYVGQKVVRAQFLCGIYSQDVYAAEMEYVALLGRARVDSPGRGEFADQERRAREELIGAARRRLALWDVSKSEIERLETSREPRRAFPLVSPRAGVVVQKLVLDGTYVDPAVELYAISDLSRVWLLADVYEADVGAVRVGQLARLDVEGLDGTIEAKVAFLPPTLDEPTRTLKIRFSLANDEGKLRPGAFATVAMNLPLGRGLAVPESAVIRTGPRAIVFVVHEGLHVMPREVTLGPLEEGFYRVDGGLSAGDVVATGAQFLLDSESRLRASSGPGSGHGGH